MEQMLAVCTEWSEHKAVNVRRAWCWLLVREGVPYQAKDQNFFKVGGVAVNSLKTMYVEER